MKRIISLILMMISLIYFADITLADIGSADLIEKGKVYDGRTVSYTGEVIGDPMTRGNYVWLNVKDKDNAMGVWVKKNLLPKIKYYGFYNSIGDTLVVQGTFHRSCIEHGGDMDIHATDIRVFGAGHPVQHKVSFYQMIMACGALLTAGLAYYLSRRKGKSFKANR